MDLLWWVRRAVLHMNFTEAGDIVECCWGLFVLPTVPACMQWGVACVPHWSCQGCSLRYPHPLHPVCESTAHPVGRVGAQWDKTHFLQALLQQVLGSSMGWDGVPSSLRCPSSLQLDMYRNGLKLHQTHFPRASRALLRLEKEHWLAQQFENPYVLFPFLFHPFCSRIHFNLKVLCSPFPERPACV